MSTEIVAMRLGASPEIALALEKTCIKYGIESMLQKAHFLGQMAQESMGFTQVVENMRYSAKRMAEVWPGRYATTGSMGLSTKYRIPSVKAIALAAAGDVAIANDVYGKRMGNFMPNDGWDFRGQGFKMVTGRGNVTQYSRDTYGDDRAVMFPTMLQNLPDAAYSGGWFWRRFMVGPHADRNDHMSVGRIINIGNVRSSSIPHGHAQRVSKTNLAIGYFEEMTQ